MLNIPKLIVDGLALSPLASIVIGLTLSINPRIMLQDYPKDIQARVPPKTPKSGGMTMSKKPPRPAASQNERETVHREK